MTNQGIIEPSNSTWSSPMHLVKKTNRGVRIVGDFRNLNLVTKFDRYKIPNLRDFTNELHDATIFSKCDLLKAFFQIPIAPEDKEKTAFLCPFGLYKNATGS
ncbi:unnamed protein product [Clavelina lepadiformis]|uniref:ribonuclease H n=1 Tax=Clavelina lepadiformis TaxID=159417 RepID=A0ABP0FQS0_CLALP